MSNRIKSVNLCDETEPIADHIMANGGNFSRFVRECLIRYYAETNGSLSCPWDEEGPRCNPHQKNRCIMCWPAGKPLNVDWASYRRAPRLHQGTRQSTVEVHGVEQWKAGDTYTRTIPGSEHFNDHEWIYDLALAANPPLFDMKDLKIKGNAKSAPRKKKRSLLKRIFSVI